MINIDPSWKSFFHEEQKKRYYIDIMQFLISEQQQNKTIYPPQEDIFNAFNSITFLFGLYSIFIVAKSG